MSSHPSTDDQTNKIYEAILEEISSGRLVGGQRLKVTNLAQRFGVSTSPVREALRQMHGEGFIKIHQNRGATVKEADASSVQNIFEVLQLLEPYFVSWFAEYAQPSTIDELQLVQDRLRDIGTQDLVQFRKLDSEFHGLICKHHYNRVAAEAWKKLRIALTVHGALLRINPVRLQAIFEEHDALIAAFRSNNAAEADAVIRKHLEGSFVQMSQQLRTIGL